MTCASVGNWKNWERVNAVTANIINNTQVNISVWDESGNEHSIDFHITFIND